MMKNKHIVIYGASGYTGRLIAEYCRELRIPFVAAGRDKERVARVIDRVPGIDDIEHEVVSVEHEVSALTELFSGAALVCNTVGPFIQYGDVVVEAALAAGAHYTDTTGEQDWVLHVREAWHDPFAEAGLVICPGLAHMYTTGEIAANIALQSPGLDTLDILVFWKGLPTYASTQTIFTILKADWFYLEHNEYQQWPLTTRRDVVVPGQHETALAVPWGGTSHPVWFKDDPRVSNVTVLGGVLNRPVMEGVVQVTQIMDEQIKQLPAAQQDVELSKIAASMQAGMPPREWMRHNTSVDSVHASGPLGRAHVVIHGNQNYKQTGLMQAYAGLHLLQRPPETVGFASGCQAFGYKALLGQLRAFGLVREPLVTRQD